MHRIGQPTCVDTQTVRRSASGIRTVSTRAPSASPSRSFTVPSWLSSASRTVVASGRTAAASRVRSAFESVVIRSGSVTPSRQTSRNTCAAR